MRTRRVRVIKTAGAAIALSAVVILLFSVWGPQGAATPKLILVLSIDQMRFDYLMRFSDLYKGGLRRLLDHGAVFSNANYRHAITSTAPGHSVILSGRHPSHSGIIANSWYDPFLKRVVNVVEDPTHSPLGGEGRQASPVNFMGFTLGDMLKQKNPESRVVAVCLKDRSAILLAGHRGDAAYWYETSGGNFVTSTYYMSKAPAWLQEWNNQRLPDRYAGKKWTRLLEDEKLYEKYAGRDAIEGEWDRKDIVFPHSIRGNPPESGFYDYLRRTPFVDELTLSVTIQAMRAHELGMDAITDILAIGFAATDVVGHTYGAESQEVMDQLLRLDLILERLFQEVDASVNLVDTLVVLTSDHGSLPLVETLQAKGIDARRANPSLLEAAVEQALETRFPGVESLIAHFDRDIYFDEEVIQKHQLERKEVEATIINALLSTGLVEAVYTHSQLLSNKPSSDPHIELFRNSFFQPRSPHLIVLPKKYFYLDPRPGGTGHGTAHDYDRHIPIVFMGTGIKPGLYPDPCGPEDIAPTMAKLLGFDYPKENDSRLLLEMIQSAPSSVVLDSK
ncbi:MAG: alkaline phosphatase family protein [Acidobacteriota bacterium]